MKIIRKTFLVIVIVFITLTISITGLLIYQKNKNVYYAKDFDIETVISKTDCDNDGIDDYTDILQGAKIEAEKNLHIKVLIIQEVIHQTTKEYVQMLYGEL